MSNWVLSLIWVLSDGTKKWLFWHYIFKKISYLDLSLQSILPRKYPTYSTKNCFRCTYVDQMIIQLGFNTLLQVQFYNIFLLMFFPLFWKVFTNILKIYELPKIGNKIPKYFQTLFLTIIIYQATSLSQFHLDSELYSY